MDESLGSSAAMIEVNGRRYTQQEIETMSNDEWEQLQQSMRGGGVKATVVSEMSDPKSPEHVSSGAHFAPDRFGVPAAAAVPSAIGLNEVSLGDDGQFGPVDKFGPVLPVVREREVMLEMRVVMRVYGTDKALDDVEKEVRRTIFRSLGQCLVERHAVYVVDRSS